jgi:peptidoglycan/xylan/chitin deacetylase (PgdA/CDA1 family)
MRGPALFVTSWDDGHPLDLRVADLLSRHGLAGTFYVPRQSGREMMTAGQVRGLAERFEVGAHTLTHVDLTTVDDARARDEVAGSRRWIEEVTGHPCSTFCFPGGRFRARHVDFVREAGFTGARTVELLSRRGPRRQSGVALIPTTVQAFPHHRRTYLKNIVRRRALGNVASFVIAVGRRDWHRTAAALIERTARHGGVFHLWGHSWEIEATGQWNRLEEVLVLMGRQARNARTLTCDQLSDHALPS